MEYDILINVYRNAIPKVIPWGNWRFRVIQPNLKKKKQKKKHCKWFELPSWYFRFTITIIIKKPIKAVYYTVIKPPDIWEHSRNVENTRLQLLFPTFPFCSQMPVLFYHCNTRLRLLYLFKMWLCICICSLCICKYIGSNWPISSGSTFLQWFMNQLCIKNYYAQWAHINNSLHTDI